MREKPKLSATGDKELDKIDQQFQDFNDNVKSMTLDRMNMAPKSEQEEQTKLSTREAQRASAPVLKPERSISDRCTFNERFRDERNYLEQHVRFIAENNEVIGEAIEFWTHPYGGMNAEFWRVPVNKPVIAPRYVAEQIKRCTYHVLKMENQVTNTDGMASYYGNMVVDTVQNRLDARPVSDKKTVFLSGAF